MARLTIRLLGGCELFDADGRLVDVSARKNRAMLGVLALSPAGSASREQLTSLLWSDRADAQARSSLRQSLAQLRHDLSPIVPPVLSTADDRVQLDIAAAEIDVLQFLRLANSDDPLLLRQCLDLFRGELLADTTIHDQGFQDWLAAERARLHGMAIEAAETLWAKLPAGERVAVARRLVALDPMRESSHLALMRSYAESGDAGLALQQYAACADLLKTELRISPGPEIEALRQRLLHGESFAGSARSPGAAWPATRDRAQTGGGLVASEPAPRLPDKPSIAVLPFINLSGDPEQDYFADGIVEEMIVALCRFGWLFVIARNSSFAYKGRSVDAKQVGHELGVRYILEGSVRKHAGRVRIAGELVDAISGAHLWADRFEGSIDDIFDLQDRVTASVVGAIAPKLEQAEIERVSGKSTESLDAYDCFLRGMAGLHRWSRDGNTDALAHFYRAIELDAEYASAYGLTARAYVQRNSGGWIQDRSREIGEATRLAHRAVELGQGDARALCTAGFALSDICGEIEVGDAWIDRALELNVNLAIAWLYSGWAKASRGQGDLALERLAQARRLSPNDPQSFSLLSAVGFAHFVARRYAEAWTQAEIAVRSRPGYLLAELTTAVCAALAGQVDQARAIIVRLRAVHSRLTIRDALTLQSMQPADLASWAEGLRLAGLPD